MDRWHGTLTGLHSSSQPINNHSLPLIHTHNKEEEHSLAFSFIVVSMSRGSSRGREKGKGTTIRWEGPLGLNFFEEALYKRFSVESKSNFSKEAPLRGYDERKEEWPKCMHGEDCLVQMFTKGIDGGRCFFKCPRAWVIPITICFFNMFIFCTTYMTYLL